MATTNDLKNGLVLNLDGELWTVVEFQHVKPGKGGAFVRTTLKNVLSGKVVDRTFNAGTKVETASVDKRQMQYLYRDGEDFVFMDLASYDQVTVPAATVGEGANYLLEQGEVVVATHEGVPLYVDLASVAVWSGDEVTMVDLDLDVVRRRADRAVRLLDEDEFAEHRVLFGYPDSMISTVTRTADALLASVAGEEPFAAAYVPWLAQVG